MEHAWSGATQTAMVWNFADLARSVDCVVTAITALPGEVSWLHIQLFGLTLQCSDQQFFAGPAFTGGP